MYISRKRYRRQTFRQVQCSAVGNCRFAASIGRQIRGKTWSGDYSSGSGQHFDALCSERTNGPSEQFQSQILFLLHFVFWFLPFSGNRCIDFKRPRITIMIKHFRPMAVVSQFTREDPPPLNQKKNIRLREFCELPILWITNFKEQVSTKQPNVSMFQGFISGRATPTNGFRRISRSPPPQLLLIRVAVVWLAYQWTDLQVSKW